MKTKMAQKSGMKDEAKKNNTHLPKLATKMALSFPKSEKKKKKEHLVNSAVSGLV